ncbi:MAG: hypothetical protein GX801_11770 [Fibrobacter sp.]|nr:hypothetical protein [Fibrobacter sp.]
MYPINGSFLLATDVLSGSYFEDTVIFLVEHSDESSFGFVINRSARIPIDEVFAGFNAKKRKPFRFFYGGPVQEDSVHVLEIGKPFFEHTPEISSGIWLKIVADNEQIPILDLFSNDTTRIILGYAGWSPDQLHSEIDQGCWEVVNPHPLEIFSTHRDETFNTPAEFKKNYILS